MGGVPISDILSGVIGKVGCHKGGVIQMFPPNILPTVDDPPVILPIGAQAYFEFPAFLLKTKQWFLLSDLQ
jgi:hypothetical protein